MKKTWTAEDEAAFQKLAEQREKLSSAQREPVKVAVHWIILEIQRRLANDVGLGSTTARDGLVDGLIARAAQVRDALAPFDDGARAAVCTADRQMEERTC